MRIKEQKQKSSQIYFYKDDLHRNDKENVTF